MDVWAVAGPVAEMEEDGERRFVEGLVVGFSHWHNAHRVGRFAFAGEMSAGVAEIAICNALLCIDNSAYISTGNLKDTEVPFPSWL